MTKQVTMINNKTYKCEIVGETRQAHNGDIIVPVVLEDGRQGLVSVDRISDLIQEEINIIEANTIALKELLEAEGIDYQVDYFGDCNQILVEGWQHQIYIAIDEDGYNLSTLHMEQSKHYGIYDELYRNQTTRKTSKAVITYVYKFL